MSKKKFDPDLDTDAGNPDDWEPISHGARRRPGMVLSVRLGSDLASGLAEFARERGTTVSDAARLALATFVAGRYQPSASFRLQDVVGSSTFSQSYSTLGGLSRVRAASEYAPLGR